MLYGVVANQWEPDIRERFPNVEIVRDSRRSGDHPDCGRVDILIGWRFQPGIFREMPNLRWIQSVAVGLDDWVSDPSIVHDVLITNTKGLYADSVAEYVLWSLLTLSRRFHTNIRNQVKRRWIQTSGNGLRHKVLGIVGLGSVGKAVAARAKAFEMRTVGIVREIGENISYPDVEDVVTFSDIQSILSDLDALVLCLPLTTQSRNLITNGDLIKMKHGAILVNVAREGIIDYSGIVEGIKEGRLAGAALDVFNNEPLKRWNRLWGIDNLLVTPHISALTSDYKMRVADFICDNISRFVSDRPLRNIVDRAKGY